jgi:hypothetical protein
VPEFGEQLVQGLTGELDLVAGACHGCVLGANAVGQVEAHGVETGVVAAGHDQLRKRRVAHGSEGQFCLEGRPAVAQQRGERGSLEEELRWEFGGVTADRDEELDDPLGVREIAVPPEPVERVDQAAPGGIVQAAGRDRRLEECERQCCLGRCAAARMAPRPP